MADMGRQSRRNRYRLLPQPKVDVHADGDRGTAPTCAAGDLQEAVFAGGSFWKLEAAFGLADGVVGTATGYCGGTLAKPTHREVLEGWTGHTEAVRVAYDGGKTSFKSLCNVFFHSHDPTDKTYLDFGAGTHHRSAIFCKDEDQKKRARESKVERQMKLNRRIVTKILPLGGGGFYPAGNAHQKHYLRRERHVRLCAGLGLRSTDQLVESHLACKLNGILGNYDGHFDQNASPSLRRIMEIHDLPSQVKLALQETLEEIENSESSELLIDI